MKAIPAAVMAVIMVVLSIMVVTDLEVPETSADGWTYDDYRLIDGATGASGSLELVDVGGVTMVHAASVGAGTWTDSSGVHSVDVAKAHLDIVLVTGQSNSTYIAANADESAAPVPEIGTAWVWATSDGNYSNLTGTRVASMVPMVASDGTLSTAAQAPAFAKEYVEESGHKLFYVCGGYSGRNVQSFVPPAMPTWTYMRGVVESALAAVDTDLFAIHTLSYVWIQGEANRTTPVDVYKDNFLAMHEAILAGELGMTFDLCVMGLPASKDAGLAVEAQRELAAERSDIIVGTDIADTFSMSNGLLASDDLHYTQEGNNLVGAALGTVCGRLAAEPVGSESAVEQLVGLVPLLLALGAVLAVLAAIFSRRY